MHSSQHSYLASGHMLNSIFGTKHNDPAKLWLVTPTGIVEYKPHKIAFVNAKESLNG